MALLVEATRYGVRDPDWFDITRAGCDRARKEGREAPGEFLAPSAGLLYGARDRLKALFVALLDGRIGDDEYAAREAAEWAAYEAAYIDEMRASWRARRGEWRALLARDRVCLACYCERPERCHRTVAARLLVRCGALFGGEVETVRAISVRQPWAWAILEAEKRIENRGPTWRNAAPGPALLHAAKGCTRAEYEAAADFIRDVSGLVPPPLAELDRGALVGGLAVRGVVAGLVPASVDRWFVGPVGLELGDVERREAVPCAGALGFFQVSRRFLRNWAPLRSMGRDELGIVPVRTASAPGNHGSQDENAATGHGAPMGSSV